MEGAMIIGIKTLIAIRVSDFKRGDIRTLVTTLAANKLIERITKAIRRSRLLQRLRGLLRS